MLSKGIIENTLYHDSLFTSNIFTREKKEGSLRIILDLSDFNKNVIYRHFKMESLNTAINLMFQDCAMASIDWKDYSCPIAFDFRRYLVFLWEGEVYRYTCYPNGPASCPRYFTKFTKVFFSDK